MANSEYSFAAEDCKNFEPSTYMQFIPDGVRLFCVRARRCKDSANCCKIKYEKSKVYSFERK